MSMPAFDSRQSPDECLASGEYPLTRRDLAEIAAMIYADAGIYLNESKASLVYSRLSKHIRNLGLKGFRDYCQLVSSPAGAAERRDMLSHLTTNFTRFFRENHHFEHMKTDVLPQLLANARNGGRVRIWSAACSDGQEPYSIALTVLSMMPNAADYDIKILATDIDTDILTRAEAGIYPAELFERLPSDVKPMLKLEGGAGRGEARISEELRRMIAFKRLNLIEKWPMGGPFDVIFCRNVFIYFDTQTKASILDRFVTLLAPGGFLYLGHSESLPQPHPNLRLIGRTIYERTA